MVKKAPRRTAERILEVTLELFNRFGEPNVSTTLISAELRISPGNLYYHYPAKDELINALFDRYERSLTELLGASGSVRKLEASFNVVTASEEEIRQANPKSTADLLKISPGMWPECCDSESARAPQTTARLRHSRDPTPLHFKYQLTSKGTAHEHPRHFDH